MGTSGIDLETIKIAGERTNRPTLFEKSYNTGYSENTYAKSFTDSWFYTRRTFDRDCCHRDSGSDYNSRVQWRADEGRKLQDAFCGDGMGKDYPHVSYRDRELARYKFLPRFLHDLYRYIQWALLAVGNVRLDSAASVFIGTTVVYWQFFP